ncbi:FIST C-terminal domain-containing protein [Eubacteriales bacterium OttesenSCG-928-A19]|nr:FIST C-terminal domain-containing protein [Eubacteriales bacterium OttesenSCG-928-A19]
MIRMLTAYTREVDDAQEAVEELLSQLDLPGKQLKHSIGIVMCYAEFLDTGVIQALSERLPFEIVGCTTIAGGVNGASDIAILTLSVLTSDDVTFETALSEPVTGSEEDKYGAIRPLLREDTALVLCFLPFVQNLGGELILSEMTETAGSVPIFGTVASDHTVDYHISSAIYHDTPHNDRVAMVVISGAVTPRFLVTSISDRRVRKQKAMITKSDGSVLQEVNGLPVMEYLDSVGLALGNGFEGVNTIPFMVDYEDGAQPVARAMYLRTPESHIICGGAMPEGATLSLGTIDEEEVVQTSTEEARAIITGAGEVHGVLMFSCLSRLQVLGFERSREMNILDSILGDTPYQICYAGGEICPVYRNENDSVNRFHNFTIVACIL